jgi:polyhydroxyalkanoate synthesis regulator phasin
MQTMPAPKSPSGGSRGSSASRSPAKPKTSKSRGKSSGKSSGRHGHGTPAKAGARGAVSDGLAGLAEQVTNGVLKPLGLVVLTTERIQEVLDDAADRGRVTRSDANELAAQLVSRGRQQTDQLLSDIERVIGFGRQQLAPASRGSRWSESIDLIVRSADRARRSVGVGQTFPILGYDNLTAAQVQARLEGLASAELRKVREYERRHANRKSVLEAIDKSLAPR